MIRGKLSERVTVRVPSEMGEAVAAYSTSWVRLALMRGLEAEGVDVSEWRAAEGQSLATDTRMSTGKPQL